MRIMTALFTLCLLALPLMAQQRTGAWEFTLAAGASQNNADLASYATTGRFMPTVAARVGYNVSDHIGLSLAISQARGAHGTSFVVLDGASYLAPSIAATFATSPASRFSPFISAGAQSTRISGRYTSTRSTWGALIGVGVLAQIGNRSALRIEGRTAGESFAGARSHTSSLMLGFSVFTNGCRRDASRN